MKRTAGVAVLAGVLGVAGLTGCHGGAPAAAPASTGPVTAVAVAGSSGSASGSPGDGSGSPSGTPGSSPATGGSSAAAPTDCTSTGTTIPAGHYAGPIKATLTTTLRLSTPAGTVPDAGSGTEVMTGSVSITSDGATVTGTLTLSGLGLSQVGLTDAPQVHSVDNGEFSGRISGPAGNPVVTGTMSGEWSSLDAPAGNTSGSATNSVAAGLHVTSAGCGAVTGDAIAMFTQIAAPVAQYLTFGGSGTWTAPRT